MRSGTKFGSVPRGDPTTRKVIRILGAGRFRITAPALAAAMRRANRGDLARLKHLLEAAV